MKTVIKATAASALALGAVAAHASISQPSSGSSDAILFAEVVNAAGTAAVASYAGDTTVSISALTSPITAKTTVLGADANLAKLFAADAAGDTIEWAVLGGQYTGTATLGNFAKAGVAQFITTTNGDSTNALSNDTSGTLVKFGGINSDITTLNSNAAGANSIEGASPATSGIWDVTNTLGTAYWDGGATPNANVLGGTQKLFYVTAGTPLGATTRVAYTQEGTVTLSAAGLTFNTAGTTPPPPPVPLPAAVWLFGSGLLGLAGVGRRKLKTV